MARDPNREPKDVTWKRKKRDFSKKRRCYKVFARTRQKESSPEKEKQIKTSKKASSHQMKDKGRIRRNLAESKKSTLGRNDGLGTRRRKNGRTEVRQVGKEANKEPLRATAEDLLPQSIQLRNTFERGTSNVDKNRKRRIFM